MRVLSFVDDRLRDLFEAARRIPHARLIAEICAVVIVLLIVIRVIIVKRLHDEQARIRVARGRGGQLLDPWAAARSLADPGQFTDAAHALYQAVLERLSGGDGLRIHPSKTAGDYARDLRRRGAPSHVVFRAFARQYDAVIFGRGECSAEEYAALLATIEPLFAPTGRARAA